LLVAGCWLLVAGCWFLVSGFWFLVVGGGWRGKGQFEVNDLVEDPASREYSL
jgi:hypothetical protein